LTRGSGARVAIGKSNGDDPATSPVWNIDNYNNSAPYGTLRIYNAPTVNTKVDNWQSQTFMISPQGRVGIGIPPTDTTIRLNVNGKIQAVGDICTNLNGGKCLSTISSSGSTYTADNTSLQLTGTTFSVKNLGISTAKLANLAVTEGKLAANSVTATKIGNGAITATKLNQMGATSGQALKWNGTAWAPTSGIERTTVSADVGRGGGPVTVSCPSSSYTASGGGFEFYAGGGTHPTTDPKRYLRNIISRPGSNSYSWYCSVDSDADVNGGDSSSGRCYVVCIR
jgi:hypothetical protein